MTEQKRGDWIFRIAPFVTGAIAIGLLAVGVFSLMYDDLLFATVVLALAGWFAVLTIGNAIIRRKFAGRREGRY